MKTLRLPVRLMGVGAAVGLMLCWAQAVVGQQYEPRISVPVTFYDFHSDRSNPEFEQPHGKYNNAGDQRPGMVERELDKAGKPKAKAPTSGGYLNQGLRFWFREWSPGTNAYSGDAMFTELDPLDPSKRYLTKFRPVYKYGNREPPGIKVCAQGGEGNDCQNNQWGASEWENNSYEWVKNAYSESDFAGVISNGNTSIDTAFKNKMIKATLWFTHQGNGIYKFSQSGFFPLNSNVSAGGGVAANGLSGNPVYGVEFPGGSTPFANKWSSTGKNRNNNYAFTMEMAQKFKMEPGLTFDFRGDDDVWVFINNQLAMDLGGIHSAKDGSIVLDNIKSSHGLENGKEYNFHMFYAERHSDESNIVITTNIVNTVITDMKIKVIGGAMQAGVPKLATAELMTDADTLLKDFKKGWFTWTAKDLNGYNTGSQLTVASARTGVALSKTDSIFVTAQKAYTTIRIYGEYYDTLSGKRIKDSADVWVGPGPAAKLYVETTSDSLQGLRSPNRLDTVKVSGSATDKTGFYAIVRDQYDNWVSAASDAKGSITWVVTASDQNIAKAEKGPNSPRGEGKAIRVGDKGTARYTVTYTPSGGSALSFNGFIKIEDIIYKAIEIGTKNGGTFVPISSSTNPSKVGTIEMVVGADTTLWVRLQRPDDTWEEVPVTWSQIGVPGVSDPSGNLKSWNIKPNGPTENGKVTATIPAGSGSGSVSVNIVVKYNDPAAARFFYKRGAPVFTGDPITSLVGTRPTTARRYAVPNAYVDLVAGEPMPIVGKLFASATAIDASTWLDPDATNSSVGTKGNGKWTWSTVDGSATNARPGATGEGILENNTGNGDSITFKSTLATYNDYVKIRGTYTDNKKSPVLSVSFEIWIRVIPDVYNATMHIEPDQNGRTISPNTPRDMSELVFSSSQGNGTSQSVYAVIRDKWGNYICQSGAVNPYQPGTAQLYPSPGGTGTTVWSVPVGSVKAEDGFIEWGEGVVTRTGADDPTKVRVCNTAWGSTVCAEVPVKFRGYDYSEIEIVVPCASGSGNQLTTIGGTTYCRVPGDTLRMNSNEDKQIVVVGKCDDKDCGGTNKDGYELVTGDWGRDPGLVEALGTPPNGSNNWTLSPDGVGDGKVTVGKGTNKDDIVVIITVGPPLRAEVLILTPADEIKAGKDVKIAINYYNRAGLMNTWDPNWTTPGSYFADTLGNGTVTAEPKVKSVAGPKDLCYKDKGNGCSDDQFINSKLAHNATNLNDGVDVVLYYAASDHRIRYTEYITVNGEVKRISAISAPFTVLPGDPHKINIEGPDGNIDTLSVDQGDDPIILHAVAEDEWGNKIGDYPSNWTGKVPIKVDETNRPIIVYVPGNATDNGCGWLTVNGGGTLKDSIWVCVSGVTFRPDYAITRDEDGCGYLDRIDIKFGKPIYFKGKKSEPVMNPDTTKIKVNYNKTALKVDKVTVNPADSTVVLWLNDVAPHSGSLQTDWLPTIVIGKNFFDDADTQVIQPPKVKDGAAPVIESAKLFRSSNHIEVKFSEKVRPDDNAIFPEKTKPDQYLPEYLFNIWTSSAPNAAMKARTRALKKSAAGGSGEDDGLYLNEDRLIGLKGAFAINDNTLKFNLTDDVKVGPPNDYINIRTSDQVKNPRTPTPVRDRVSEMMPVIDGNVPTYKNRKVAFTLGDQGDATLKPIPNPASPSDQHVPKGVIYATNDKTAVEKIYRNEIGGAAFEVNNIYIPGASMDIIDEKTGQKVTVNTSAVKIRCRLKVYDLAGNLVNSAHTDDALKTMDKKPENENSVLQLYWNGYNSKAMKVAPGTYRIVVEIKYDGVPPAAKYVMKDSKHTGLVGISK